MSAKNNTKRQVSSKKNKAVYQILALSAMEFTGQQYVHIINIIILILSEDRDKELILKIIILRYYLTSKFLHLFLWLRN